MAARGNANAKAEVEEYDAKIADPSKLDELERKYGAKWYGYGYSEDSGGYARDCPDLIAAVETLGEKANGGCAKLEVTEIPDGTSWEIKEYDGMEWVAETHRTW